MLVHDLPDAGVRDEHVQGWRFQLSLFANVVADEVYAGAAATADAWFDAWAIVDSAARLAAFAAICRDAVQFRDRYSVLEGVEDIAAHAGAAQRFMPGIRLRRKGDVRQCQGVVLADWAAVTLDGAEPMTGVNVFVLDVEGRIASATGLTNPPGRT